MSLKLLALDMFIFVYFSIMSHTVLCLFLCVFVKYLKQISDIFVTALNQGLIQFELKADIRIIVYITQQTLGKFVCNQLFLLIWTNAIVGFYKLLQVHKKQQKTKLSNRAQAKFMPC